MRTIPRNNGRRKTTLRYYDLKRNWKRRVEPHLQDEKLNAILIRDFNKYTFGRWRKRFGPGLFPREFESCDWWSGHRGPEPRFWRYVKHSACHWLVNFNLRLAQLVEPPARGGSSPAINTRPSGTAKRRSSTSTSSPSALLPTNASPSRTGGSSCQESG